ncbi:ABC transporter permease [Pseudonocardia sp. GCM10023141]|uniref:ABC transporter permease n=1 Tax=Pseudonocardia sp. GCM10023141 TaxID=3252653 RepID=UPI0036163406
MMPFAARRLVRGLLVVLLATFLAVALLSLAPGSVAASLLGDQATPEAVATLTTRLGLDQPIPVQYWRWLTGLARGDFGTSVLTNQPVIDAILQRLPVTVEIAVLAEVIALGAAVPGAIWAASRPGDVVDRLCAVMSSAAMSIPAFVAAPVLVYLLAIKAGIFPVTGWNPIEDGVGANLRSALLPAFAVALPEFAAFQRLLRTDLGTTLAEDYIAAARARGLTGSYVLWRHALRPSSLSLLTLAGISIGRLLGGTVIVESLFSLPGLGQLVIQSITARDVIVVQGIVAFVVIVYVLLNTLVDITYGAIDPRVRHEVAR